MQYEEKLLDIGWELASEVIQVSLMQGDSNIGPLFSKCLLTCSLKATMEVTSKKQVCSSVYFYS